MNSEWAAKELVVRQVTRSVLFCLLVIGIGVGSGCATGSDKDAAAQPSSDPSAPGQPLTEELSLKADRSELDGLRAEVPEDIRRENDELALILKDMAGGDQPPDRIRERFNRALRLYREKSDKHFRQERETFTAEERSKRDQFLTELKTERDKFTSRRKNAATRKRFFDDQEMKRRAFFATEREKRADFESRFTQRRREVDDLAREKSNQFNQELRAYTQTYWERRKAEAQKKRVEHERERAAGGGGGAKGATAAPGVSEQDEVLLQEMNQAPRGKAIPLKAE
jgi:hypothetical protein